MDGFVVVKATCSIPLGRHGLHMSDGMPQGEPGSLSLGAIS